MKLSSVILLLSAFFGQYVVCSWPPPTRCPGVRLMNGKVRVRARGRIIRFDCYEGYTLVGNRYASCMHGEWDTPVPVCVSTRCPAPQAPAHTFMGSKLDGAILMFFCEPGYSLVGPAEIYCDGRSWNGTIPSCRDSPVPPPTKCDFESLGLCRWEPDPHHDFDWKRHNFATSRSFISTGPTHDHTLGAGNDGHYLYTEASGQLVNDAARIISPLYNSSLTESGCFSFWYHMFGISIGALNIYFKPETNSKQLMFSKNGNQGNQWLQGIFNLPKSNVSFQIIVEGVRGLSYVSDIAIDDVAILQGNECIVKNNFTSVTESNLDQVEIINAQQTCRGRCIYSMTDVTTTTPKFGPENCHCTLDCAERSICCPDYEEYCTAVFTITEMTEMTTYEITTPTTRQTTTRSTPRTTRNITRPTTMRPITLRPNRVNITNRPPIYINPKDYIDPVVSTMPNTTTRRLIPTTITPEKRTTTARSPKRTTTPPVRRNQTETWKTTSAPGTHGSLTTRYMELQDRSELHSEEQNPEKVKHDGRFDPLLIGLVSATVIVFSLTLVITIVVIRRRRTAYKRGSGSALSEDSDVRFLTSDEILDFNLARPAENEEM